MKHQVSTLQKIETCYLFHMLSADILNLCVGAQEEARDRIELV